MAETFRLHGNVSSGTRLAITPPAGKAYVLAQGGIAMHDKLRFGYQVGTTGRADYAMAGAYGGYAKPFFPVTNGIPLSGPPYPEIRLNGSGELGNLNADEALHIVADYGISGDYCITGPVVNLADEGIESARTFGIWGALNATTWRTVSPMPAGYCYFVSQVFAGAGTSVRLLASDGSFIMDLPLIGSFWLWSEMALKFEFYVGSTNNGCGVRVTRYAETPDLEEYVNRISYNQVMAGLTYIDLIPPADEVWYIDLTNAMSVGITMKWNGTAVLSTNPRNRLQLSAQNWMRFHNTSASSLRLFITGTKLKD